VFRAYTLPPVLFTFGEGSGIQKMPGLLEFGPYQKAATGGPPRFGFVFPSEYRDQANRLYLALKNGIGYFRGVENTFRFPLAREHVFSITGFSIKKWA
jgi:hypothetical protein